MISQFCLVFFQCHVDKAVYHEVDYTFCVSSQNRIFCKPTFPFPFLLTKHSCIRTHLQNLFFAIVPFLGMVEWTPMCDRDGDLIGYKKSQQFMNMTSQWSSQIKQSIRFKLNKNLFELDCNTA